MLLALAVFLANIADDIICVFYIRRTTAGKAIQASVLSGILTIVVGFSVIIYTDKAIYLIPTALGSAIGTYLAIKLDKHLRRKKNEKKKKADKAPSSAPKKVQGAGKRRDSNAKGGEARGVAQAVRAENDPRSDKTPSESGENPLPKGDDEKTAEPV